MIGKNNKTALELAQLLGAVKGVAYRFTHEDEVMVVHPSSRYNEFDLEERTKEELLKAVKARFDLRLSSKQHHISDAVAIALAALRAYDSD